IWAILYFGFTLGGPASATIGMRTMDLEMRTWYGAPAYFVLGAMHAIAFWFTISSLRHWFCWFPSSTTDAGFCTTFCSAPWLSITTLAHPCCGGPCSPFGPGKGL